MFDKLPFVMRLLWDPARALDLVDKRDKPDHGKMLPAALLAAVLLLKVLGFTFAWYELLILASLCGGVSLIRTLIASGAIKGTGTAAVSVIETTSKHVSHIIQERRDPALGIDPTPE